MKSKSDSVPVLRLYGSFVKYKLSLAVAFSSATGYIICCNKADRGLFAVTIAVFLLASGSAALNEVQEKFQDGIMDRTRERPIPSGKLSLERARTIVTLLLISGGILCLFSGIYPFLLGISCIFLYNYLYTYLKSKSIFAVIPGALVGAIPPVIGFVAAGGSISDLKIVTFSAFMFLWQLPHFWLVILKYRDDYSRAGFKTIGLYLDDKQIRKLVICWVLLTSLFILIFFCLSNVFGKYFARIILVLNPVFVVIFAKTLLPAGEEFRFRSTFIILNSFGLLVMIALIVDSILKGA